MRDTLNTQIGNHYTILPSVGGGGRGEYGVEGQGKGGARDSLNIQTGYCNTKNAPWGWEEPASILKLYTIIQYSPGWGGGQSGEGQGPSLILPHSTQYTDSSYCEFDLKYTK